MAFFLQNILQPRLLWVEYNSVSFHSTSIILLTMCCKLWFISTISWSLCWKHCIINQFWVPVFALHLKRDHTPWIYIWPSSLKGGWVGLAGPLMRFAASSGLKIYYCFVAHRFCLYFWFSSFLHKICLCWFASFLPFLLFYLWILQKGRTVFWTKWCIKNQ